MLNIKFVDIHDLFEIFTVSDVYQHHIEASRIIDDYLLTYDFTNNSFLSNYKTHHFFLFRYYFKLFFINKKKNPKNLYFSPSTS